MGAGIIVHRACDVRDLPLAAALLSDHLHRSDQTVDSSAAHSGDDFQTGIWLGSGAPSGPVHAIAAARTWLAYAGDPSGWKAGVAGALKHAGVDFVLAERYPDEWPDELPRDEWAWLVEHWMPSPVAWDETAERPLAGKAPERWIVVMPAGEEPVERPRRTGGRDPATTRNEALALVEAGMAELVTLTGAPIDWQQQIALACISQPTGVVAASCNPVFNHWLWSLCAQKGWRCFIAGTNGSPWRWALHFERNSEALPGGAGLRGVLGSWMRVTRGIASGAQPSSSEGVVCFGRSSFPQAFDPCERGTGVMRRLFGGGCIERGPFDELFETDRRMVFWRALLDHDPALRSAALRLPADHVADSVLALAECSGVEPWNLVFRRVHATSPEAWEVIERAMKRSHSPRIGARTWTLFANGLFLGAAQACEDDSRRELLERACRWHREGESNNASGATKPVRAWGLPLYLASDDVDAAEMLWRSLFTALSPVEWSVILWRSFAIGMPRLERGDPGSRSVNWIVDRMAELEENDDWRPVLAFHSTALRLYTGRVDEAVSWARDAHARGFLSSAQIAGVALLFWLMDRIDAGRSLLALVTEDGSSGDDAAFFPLFCARELLDGPASVEMRERARRLPAAFYAETAPPNTRCFFGGLALAAAGLFDEARELREHALKRDPMAAVRDRHWQRVGLAVAPR